MAILKSDIKLLASERLTDFHDGGGAMTGNEVISGELNNLFPDISRLDRVYGRVSLRKCFPAVLTANQDMYYGAHAIITAPPDDDNVYVTMFSRDDFTDIREDARNRIESYISIGGQTLLRPMYDQLEGQRAIVCFQSVGNPSPEAGKTIALLKTSTGEYQYVRITGVAVVRTTFQTSTSTFSVDVVTLDLSAPLAYKFPGIEPTPYTTLADTKIHDTIVADASKYYGVSKVNQSIDQGDFNLWVDSIYNQLVPTSQIESPVVDQFMGGDTFTYYPKGDANSLTFSGARSDASSVIHLPEGVMPGSLNITIVGYSFIDLKGLLVATDTDGGFSGSIDYASGQITIEKSSWSGTVSLTATPAVPISESYMTMEIEIELANRSYNYTPNLNKPLPQPGNIYIDYMAQGKWYRLFDDGRGIITAREENTGTGTIDYVSGSMIVTLGALPDVGTSIIISWGVGIVVTDRSGSIDGTSAEIFSQLPDVHIDPGSIVITWDDNGTKTMTDDGNGGFTGDGSGRIDYGNGEMYLLPSPMPPSGTALSVDYDKEDGAAGSTHGATDATYSGGNNEIATFTIPGAPILEGTLGIKWDSNYDKTVHSDGHVDIATKSYSCSDDGLGSIISPSGASIGSINYSTGEVSFVARQQYDQLIITANVNTSGRYYTAHSTATVMQPEPSVFACTFTTTDPASLSSTVDTISAPELVIGLTPSESDNNIVPNSIIFTMDGDTYYDVNGDVYKDKDSSTGVGSYAGTVNYDTGKVAIVDYLSISSTVVNVLSMLTKNFQVGVYGYTFKTPGAPVRDGSFSCRVNDAAGSLYTAISTTGGDISDTQIEGTIDTTNGVVRISFGGLVVAAGNEAEPWYDASLVEDGNIWKPMMVIPETALYNAVMYSTLPLDAELIGIEPIRLPTDGRVPIFKPGDVCVVHHNDTEPIGNTFTNSQVISLSRDHLSIVDLYDYNDNLIGEDDSKYTVDLLAGTITVIDDGSYLNGFTNGNTENVVANHRIEDMILLSEVQINGFVTSVGPITHAYPAIGAQLSTALIFGDLAGRVVRLFHQKTWDGVWRDFLSGDAPSAKYDTLNYPFIIQNEGSADQRWCVKFTSSTTVEVIGETFGIIGAYNIANEIAPINPATASPYFTILNSGWGTGWATGNNIRFDTTAANYPVWLARTTMQGEVVEPTDNFVIQIRGDAN